jgi:hypothetical protein
MPVGTRRVNGRGGGVVDDLRRQGLINQAKEDPAGFLARAIRCHGDDGDLDFVSFDPVKRHEVFLALQQALEQVLGTRTAAATTPVQRATLLSDLALHLYSGEADLYSDADAKRVVADWLGRNQSKRRYHFVAALCWTHPQIAGDPEIPAFDAGSFTISNSWSKSKRKGAPREWSPNWDAFNDMLFIGGEKEAQLPTQAISFWAQRIEEVIGAMLALDLARLATHSEVAKHLGTESFTSFDYGEHTEYTKLPPGWMTEVDGASFPPLRVREMSLRIVANHAGGSRAVGLFDPSKASKLRTLFGSVDPSAGKLRRACRHYARAVTEPDLGELIVRCAACLENLLLEDSREPGKAALVFDVLARELEDTRELKWLTDKIFWWRNQVVHAGSLDEKDMPPASFADRALDLVSGVLQTRIDLVARR